MANTILLKGRGIRKEAVAGGAFTPGHLLTFNNTGKLIAHATAGGAVAPLFAVENDLEGKEISQAYAENDYAQSEYLWSGCEALAFLKDGSTAVIIGDLLESAGDGSLRKLASGVAIAQSQEAVDNSGGSGHARIKVTIL